MRDPRLKNEMQREGLARLCANYMIEYDMTIREVEKEVCTSRGTVHRLLSTELKWYDDELFVRCRNIMKRHIHDHKRRKR